MKILCIHLYIPIITLTPLVFATVEFEREVPDVNNCNPNLSSYQITTSYGPKNVCAYISDERLAWKDAKFRCSLHFAQLTQQIHFNSSLHTHLIKKGIDILWIGILRRNDFFVTEYPSKLFREVDAFSPDYWGFHWSEGEPGPDDCVALNISSGSLQTHNCSDILPFVCDDGGRDTNITYKNFTCPEGWNHSLPLSSNEQTCIILQELTTYETASELCRKNNGRLASYTEYIKLSTSKTLSSRTKSFWLVKRNSELCEAATIFDAHTSKIHLLACKYVFRSICVKHQNIKAHLSPKSIKPVPSYSKDATDLLTCNVDTEFSDVNIENDFLIQWYKNGLPIAANSYVIRLSFIGDELKRDPYISDIASRQGLYHCEVQFPGSNEKYSSQKIEVTYTDIASYLIEIHGIKQTNDFDFSHQHFSEYMDDFERASINNVFEKIKSRYGEAHWDFVSKSILNGEAIMNIVVYIFKSELKDFDERMACEALKDSFEELYSIPVFMDTMSAYINCEVFPIRNADIQILKSLRNVEDKLNRIEHKQEYILKKLQEYERSRPIKSEDKKTNYDTELFLSAIDELNSIDYTLFEKGTKVRNSENEHNQRETNELEDDFFPPTGNRYIAEAKRLIMDKSSAQNSKSGNYRKVKENYIYNPSKERKGTARNNVVFKDL